MEEKKGKKELKESIAIEEGAKVQLDAGIIIFTGEKGEVKRKVADPILNIEVKEKEIIITADKNTKKEKKKVRTLAAHIKNMMRGVKEGHLYKLKICSGHFPMNVAIDGDNIVVKNFLGEKVPRKTKLLEGAKVNIEGDIITVEGVSKELTGQAAADIEKLCKITNRDLRRFQDGIYITMKDGKEIK